MWSWSTLIDNFLIQDNVESVREGPVPPTGLVSHVVHQQRARQLLQPAQVSCSFQPLGCILVSLYRQEVVDIFSLFVRVRLLRVNCDEGGCSGEPLADLFDAGEVRHEGGSRARPEV